MGQSEASGSTLLRALASGRATLLLGQRHSPGLLDSLKRDIAAITDQPDSDDLVRLLSAVRDDSSLEGLRRAFEIHPVAPELVEVAENPWSYVLTSAVDPQVHEAFQRPGSSGRQLRVMFAGHAGTLARSGSTTLTLLRLFGALEERDPTYRPPTSDLELRKQTRLDLPLVLSELPRLIGPGGHLAVVGVGSDDWLDVETLALSCGDLPEGSVHWFSSHEQPIPTDELQSLFGDRLRLYTGSLASEFAVASTDSERAALDQARTQLLHPAGRQMTIRRGEESAVVAFSPDEWRRLSQIAVVLDDDVVQPPPLGEEEERQAFRDFLYRVQRIPDWAGVARGFLFEREAALSLLERVERELAAPRSVHATDAADLDDVSRRSSRLPILIQGAPASGKSRLLHWLAYQLRLRDHVVVYVLPTRGRGSFEQVERVCCVLEDKTRVSCAGVE